MRAGVVVWLSIGIGALAGWPSGAVVGQEVAVAARSPRFLYASAVGAAPVEIDASHAAVLRHVVSLQVDEPTVGRLLAAIERQTGLTFAYGNAIRPDRPVTLRADSITVASALAAVLYDSGVDVVLSAGGHVTLVRRAEALPPPVGSISGKVTDAKTATALVGATVVVEGTSRSAMTGNDGRYRIADMAPGTYTVRARYIGYAPATSSVAVVADQEATADFALAKSAQKLDDVVTTGTLIPTEVKALPTPITVITAEDLERQHPRRFDELIRLAVPTAVVWEPDPTGAASGATGLTISLRGVSGFTNSGPKIYIDGIETADNHNLSLDPQSIERIEVVRGPQAAAIYGSDAMGGVIQVFTKRGTNERRPEIETTAALGRIESAFVGSGSFRQEYTADVSGRSGAAGYRLGAGYRRTGDWVPEYRESVPNLNGNLSVEQGPFAVDLRGRFEQVEYTWATNPLLLQTIPWYRNAKDHFTGLAARGTYRPLRWWHHELTAGVDERTASQVQTRARRVTPEDTLLDARDGSMSRLSVAYRTTLVGQLMPGLAATLTLGGDYYTYIENNFSTSGALKTLPLVLAPGQSIYAYRARTTNTGIFAQGQLNLRETLFFTGSLRADDNSNFGDELSWPRSTRLGVTYVHPLGAITVKLRASYGEAIRSPIFGARDSIDYGFGCCIQLPNPGLRPERQSGPDAGLDLVLGRIGTLGVTYYNQTARDFVFAIITDTVAFNYQLQNVARVRNQGWEFEGALDFGRLTARANFAVTHSRPEVLGRVPETVDLRVGQQMTTTPWHTAGLAMTGTPRNGTNLTAAIAYQGEWLAYDYVAYHRCQLAAGPCSSADYYGSYPAIVKFNLGVDQQLARSITGYLSVEDLTNRGSRRAQYNFVPLPGRISTIGVRVRY